MRRRPAAQEPANRSGAEERLEQPVRRRICSKVVADEDTAISRGRLYLSDEEAAALNRDINELLERYDAGRTSRNRPADAIPRNQYWLLLPHAPRRDR